MREPRSVPLVEEGERSQPFRNPLERRIAFLSTALR